MAISIEKVVFNPFVLGLIGFALLSLSMKLNSKKILNLKLNPLAYVGFLLCLYFLFGVAVVFTSDIYWLLFCIAGLALAWVVTEETFWIGVVFVILTISFLFNKQLSSLMMFT